MKSVFSIGSANKEGGVLLFEFGPDFCCYAFLDKEQRRFKHIHYYSLDETEGEEQIPLLLGQIPNEGFDQILVSCAYEQALLTPQEFFKADDLVLHAIYDLPGQNYLYDQVAEWQLVNTYSLPSTVFDAIKSRFPDAEFIHAYTPGLRIYNGFNSQEQIDLHFSIRRFRVLVKKENQILLAQTYAYKTPLDVVYCLLKVCYEFQLDQKQVFLIISGLVEQGSPLYAELQNYFLHLHFPQASGFSLPGQEHHPYYFHSLYNLAACVS